MSPTFPLIILVTAVDVHTHFIDEKQMIRSYVIHGYAVSKNSPSPTTELIHISLSESEMDHITSEPFDLTDYILEMYISKTGEIVGGIIDDTCKTK